MFLRRFYYLTEWPGHIVRDKWNVTVVVNELYSAVNSKLITPLNKWLDIQWIIRNTKQIPSAHLRLEVQEFIILSEP
jgi:hypothetical protein